MPETSTVLLILLAFFAGGLVKGVIGLGMPTVALAILASVLGLRESLPLLVVPIILTNIAQLVQGGSAAKVLRRFRLLNVCAFAGVWAGVAVLFAVDPLILSGVLGIVVCAYAASNLLTLELRVPQSAERWLTVPVGLGTGIMTGMTGSSVFPLIPYLHGLGMDRDALIRALAYAFLVSYVALALALGGHGALDATVLSISVLALAPAFAGMYAGRQLRTRLSEGGFRTAFCIGLLILGANLVRKGFF